MIDEDMLAERDRPVSERIEEGALEREQDRNLPFEQIRWLKDAGFGGTCVPVEFGGDERSWSQFIRLLIELTAADSDSTQVVRGHIAFVETGSGTDSSSCGRGDGERRPGATAGRRRGGVCQPRGRTRTRLRSGGALQPRNGGHGSLFNVLDASSTSTMENLDRHWRSARTVARYNLFIYEAGVVGDWTVSATPPPFVINFA